MLVRYGGWCSAVQYGKNLLAGWLRSRVAVAVARRGRVCVNEGQCLSLPPFLNILLCSALRACFFFVLLGLV
jgi:hypothetical protein